MILVQSHPLQLSGNNIVCLLASMFILLSCGTSGKVVKTPVAKKLVVHIDKNNNKAQLPEKIDTIDWKEEPVKIILHEEKNVPEIKLEKPEEEKITPLTKLNVLALIPFRSDEIDTTGRNIPISNLRFVHYYAGMKMAIEEFRVQESIPVSINVFDSGEENHSGGILSTSGNTLDLVIGPYKIDAVKKAAIWAKENNTILISPWISSPSITERNPYYFQAKAGLNTHFNKINDHARTFFPVENIILISKSKEESRLKLFNSELYGAASIKEEIISEEDLAIRAEPILEKLFKSTGPTVFILPMASSRDENYIYHFLRRVTSEMRNKEVYIYGLYKWIEMKTEILEYVSKLNVRISISNFVDNDRPIVKEFKKKYFEKYREFPSDDAMEAYDLTKYLLRSFNKYGKKFYLNNNEPPQDYLETQFHFVPVYKNKNNRTDEIEYFENCYIKLVELKEYKFKIID